MEEVHSVLPGNGLRKIEFQLPAMPWLCLRLNRDEEECQAEKRGVFFNYLAFRCLVGKCGSLFGKNVTRKAGVLVQKELRTALKMFQEKKIFFW